MGVINVTPDSFSDGGEFYQIEQAIRQGELLASQGADLLDVGGESTRPFSEPVPLQEELRRVIPVIAELAKRLTIPISVDTAKAEVARAALEVGATVINDITALRADPEMSKVAAAANVPVVLMHMQGTPRTMQKNPRYDALLAEIISFLQERVQYACAAGIDRKQLLIDPGIGFGKTVRHNLLLLKHLDALTVLQLPILLGTSRKSFIGAVLDKEVTEREPGSWATACVGILHGAHILRVHEVEICRQLADMVDTVLHAD
ncbi:MAG: dihydropteroate synthase [Deltaproteobacteria bacterium]|nr:dihydropteroate synthase [Deltaproteobacteria bacterium]MBW2071701.1 dihydropteroate synthase [Deltaproteobacteria bacterium]